MQEAASKTLTLGLDLWFSETYQQLELLNAILNDKSRLLNVDTSKAYSLLLNQFTRHSTVSKLVSCGLNTLKLDEEKKETKEHGEDKNIFLQTLRLLLDINEQQQQQQ